MESPIISYPWTSHVTFDPETDLPIYDRSVPSEVLRNINHQYYTDGVFAVPATSFKVTVADDGMKVIVSRGGVNINGTTGYMPNTVELDIEAPGGIARTDAVVLRWDESDDVRAIVPAIVKGVGAEKPLPARSDTVYELIIAYITVRASATRITLADIEDTRLNTYLCGLVRWPQETPNTDPYFTQIEALIQAVQQELTDAEAGTAFELKPVIGNDITVEPSAFVSYTPDSAEETALYNDGYVFRAAVPVANALETMYPYVTFAVVSIVASGGTFANQMQAYLGGFYIYASVKPTAAITVLAAELRKDVS